MGNETSGSTSKCVCIHVTVCFSSALQICSSINRFIQNWHINNIKLIKLLHYFIIQYFIGYTYNNYNTITNYHLFLNIFSTIIEHLKFQNTLILMDWLVVLKDHEVVLLLVAADKATAFLLRWGLQQLLLSELLFVGPLD